MIVRPVNADPEDTFSTEQPSYGANRELNLGLTGFHDGLSAADDDSSIQVSLLSSSSRSKPGLKRGHWEEIGKRLNRPPDRSQCSFVVVLHEVDTCTMGQDLMHHYSKCSLAFL